MTWRFSWQPTAVLRLWIHFTLDWAQFPQVSRVHRKKYEFTEYTCHVLLVIKLNDFIEIYFWTWVTVNLSFIWYHVKVVDVTSSFSLESTTTCYVLLAITTCQFVSLSLLILQMEGSCCDLSCGGGGVGGEGSPRWEGLTQRCTGQDTLMLAP